MTMICFSLDASALPDSTENLEMTERLGPDAE